MIKFPPIKLQPLPEYLIFKMKSSPENSPFLRYSAKIFSTNDGEIRGETVFRPFEIERKQLNDSYINSMYIDYLYVYDRNNGFGTKLLDYVKSCSYEKGFNGYFHVCSSSVFFPDKSPHVFYRKYGMTSENIEKDALIDRFAKENRTMTYKDLDDLLMYYPEFKIRQEKPLEVPSQNKFSSIKTKCKNLITIFFKHKDIK